MDPTRKHNSAHLALAGLLALTACSPKGVGAAQGPAAEFQPTAEPSTRQLELRLPATQDSCSGRAEIVAKPRPSIVPLMSVTPREMGRRVDLRSKLAELATPELERSLSQSVAWLIAHQSPNGSWTRDGSLLEQLDPSIRSKGDERGDVSATSLALLVLLGQGGTPDSGPHQAAVARGIRWLRWRQDPDTGIIGAHPGREGLFDHALAALAIAESYATTFSPLLKRTCKQSIAAIMESMSPNGGWRIDATHADADDVVLTAWNISALVSARNTRVEVPDVTLEATLAWLQSITDPATELVDYGPDRPEGTPVPRQQAMTAAALFCRLQLGATEPPQLERLARALAALPLDTRDTAGVFFTANALYQVGGTQWRAMESRLQLSRLETPADNVLPATDACERAALNALTKEVYFRLPRFTEAPPKKPEAKRSNGVVF